MLGRLVGSLKAAQIRPMTASTRSVACLAAFAAALALCVAFAAEDWGGHVPCALCLVERWPYRIALVGAGLALLLPGGPARFALALVGVAALAGAAVSFVHVGVEQGWWPSPLPECAAPHFHGGSIAERLASMPATPGKPCDEGTYLIPAIPISMALMNLLYALAVAGFLLIFVARTRRPPDEYHASWRPAAR